MDSVEFDSTGGNNELMTLLMGSARTVRNHLGVRCCGISKRAYRNRVRVESFSGNDNQTMDILKSMEIMQWTKDKICRLEHKQLD